MSTYKSELNPSNFNEKEDDTQDQLRLATQGQRRKSKRQTNVDLQETLEKMKAINKLKSTNSKESTEPEDEVRVTKESPMKKGTTLLEISEEEQ